MRYVAGLQPLEFRPSACVHRRLAGEDDADRADRPGDAGQPLNTSPVVFQSGLASVPEGHQGQRDDHGQDEVRHADAQDGREPPPMPPRPPRVSSDPPKKMMRDVSAPGEPGEIT